MENFKDILRKAVNSGADINAMLTDIQKERDATSKNLADIATNALNHKLTADNVAYLLRIYCHQLNDKLLEEDLKEVVSGELIDILSNTISELLPLARQINSGSCSDEDTIKKFLNALK